MDSEAKELIEQIDEVFQSLEPKDFDGEGRADSVTLHTLEGDLHHYGVRCLKRLKEGVEANDTAQFLQAETQLISDKLHLGWSHG